jgi:hypothetical protein
MCFGGKPKTPTIVQEPTPTPAPRPVITPSEVSPQEQEQTRRKRLERQRRGFVSTLKTSSRGTSGVFSDLVYPSLSGKKKLGD